MTENDVEKKLVKPLALVAGIIGLIQGITWIIFSLLCIFCYHGVIDGDKTLNNDIVYYKYIYILFLHSDTVEFDNNLIIKPEGFYVFMWLYFILSILWSIISGTIIWAMIHNQWHLLKHIFSAWSLITTLNAILDIILTSLLASDYRRINDHILIMDNIVSLDNIIIPVCYGIVMSLAARGYVLWIINIIFACTLLKFVIDNIKKENQVRASIINGYERTDNGPSMLNGSAQLWGTPNTEPQTPPTTDGGYQNYGFERSQSFFPATSYDKNYPENNNTVANGKIGGKSTNNYSGPFIPDPDYTPPGSPTLKSVLRSKSNY